MRDQQPGARTAGTAGPIIAGPRWYRARIRIYGPFLGAAPMALMGGTSLVAAQAGDNRASGLIELFGGVAAAPGLLVVGAPFADGSRYPMAVLASVPLWFALGFLASRRATSRVVASWRDYWRELAWLTAGVVAGAVGALIAASAILGESLIL